MPLEDLDLATPWALLALVPVLCVLIFAGWRRRARRMPAMRFSNLALLDDVPQTWAAKLAWLPAALRLLALAAIAVALARPQLVGPPQKDSSEGIDIVLAVDTSCSMRAADFQPNDRMFVAKQAIEAFVTKRETDRIGLVVFAGEAASWVPLTLDYALVRKMLDEVEVGMIEDGTAIGNAVATSLNRLRTSEAKSKVVVLLTDGDNNRGTISPLEAADFASELDVKVYTILIGKGGPVPFPSGKDPWGRVIYRNHDIPTNPKLLEQIASRTSGEAYRATDRAELDARLNQVLDSLEKTEIESSAQLRPYAELFPHAVALALALLLFEMLLSASRFWRFP